MEKSLLYFQSGGPTSVINCSLYGALTQARKEKGIAGIFGSRYGIEGLINDDVIDLQKWDEKQVEDLKQMPGAALGSSRKKMPSNLNDPLYQSILTTLAKHNVGYILVNGGNDSMDTCRRLNELFVARHLNIAVLGIPKTIDNDLALTDHSIGYPSAALHVIDTTAMIIDDAKAYKKGKIVLVEVMGRDTGWLTAATDLLPEGRRPDLIYVPERAWDEEQFMKDVQGIYAQKGYAVCALSEGMPIRHHNDCGIDPFGHHPLEGCCLSLGHLIDEKLHIPNRTIELSIPCRADPYLRSSVDIKEAIRVGEFAVKKVVSHSSGMMVALKRISQKPYRSSLVLVPVEKVADQTVFMPASYLGDSAHFTSAFQNYLRPLLGSTKIL
jgi:6-phosphofructokinase